MPSNTISSWTHIHLVLSQNANLPDVSRDSSGSSVQQLVENPVIFFKSVGWTSEKLRQWSNAPPSASDERGKFVAMGRNVYSKMLKKGFCIRGPLSSVNSNPFFESKCTSRIVWQDIFSFVWDDLVILLWTSLSLSFNKVRFLFNMFSNFPNTWNSLHCGLVACVVGTDNIMDNT